jgi:hypothetical protein
MDPEPHESDDLRPGEAWIEINGVKYKATNIEVSHEPLKLQAGTIHNIPPVCSTGSTLIIGNSCAADWFTLAEKCSASVTPTHYTATVSDVPGIFVGSTPFAAMDKAVWAASMYQTLRDRLLVPRPRRLVAWLFPEDN